jgi:hypothetical protein
MLGEVNRLEADILGVGKLLLVHVSDQHGCRAKDARGRCSSEPTGPAPAT